MGTCELWRQRLRRSDESARAERAASLSACLEVASAFRALRPRRLAAALLLAASALLLAPNAYAQSLSEEDLWNHYTAIDDDTAPYVEAVDRVGPERTTAAQVVLQFLVRFSEPVLAVPGDFDILGVNGEWRRVGHQILPHYDDQERLMEAGDPLYEPCNPDYGHVHSHLSGVTARRFLDRLGDECLRRMDMSRHWWVQANANITYGEVNLGIDDNHDLADAAGNRLDTTLPTGDAY